MALHGSIPMCKIPESFSIGCLLFTIFHLIFKCTFHSIKYAIQFLKYFIMNITSRASVWLSSLFLQFTPKINFMSLNLRHITKN